MTDYQWKIFCDFKDDLKNMVAKWQEQSSNLIDLQKKAAQIAKTPDYSFETPVVYNQALEEISKDNDIKLIVIGDNPGKDEQLAKNNKYLVGQAGKIAEGFFKRNENLGIDFRKNVIILNKTPIHSAKTSQLKTIAKLGGEKIAANKSLRYNAHYHNAVCGGVPFGVKFRNEQMLINCGRFWAVNRLCLSLRIKRRFFSCTQNS